MRIDPRLLVGTWQLISAEFRGEEEDPVYPWGKTPVGYLFYAARGHMSATLAHSRRPLFVTQDYLQASLEELAQAARSYLAYVGTYSIVEEAEAILHHIETCLFPNWTGEKHLRFVEELTAETLLLRCPPVLVAGKEKVGYICWRKAE